MQPPPYDEVIETYDLHILKSPGDLILKNGDLALTKSGDLMLNSAEYSAMFRLVQGWRYNAPMLRSLFDLVFAAKDRRKELDERINTAFALRHFQPAAPNPFLPGGREVTSFHEATDEMAANELGASTCAGSVVLVLSGLLQAFKDDMSATRDDWEKSAPLIEGCSVGMVLTASANNFRHNDEWIKTQPPTPQQLSSLRVLAAVFREPIAPDGAGHRLSRNICPETLDLLSGGTFDRLTGNVFAFANNMVMRREQKARP